MEPWTTYYRGRRWDAPFTDDAVLMPDGLAELILVEGSRNHCVLCQELMLVDDDLILTPGMAVHLECSLRSALGDVAHLEGRCMCNGGSDHEDGTYREQAKATVQWLIDNNRGRFHDE